MGVKEAVRTKLLSIYKEHGLNVAIQVGYEVLGKMHRTSIELSEEREKYIKTNMNGEISETVLEIILMEYMKLHPEQTKEWHISKGLILRDPTKRNSRFMTELDLTLFTPKCVYVYECKSFAGEKRIIGKGEIIRLNGNSCDAFRQNAIHVTTLHNNIKTYSSKPLYQMRLFDFSRGSAQDDREQKYKDLLPYVTVGNVLNGFSTGEDVWYMPALLKAVKSIEAASERLRPIHLRYVKELHNK